MQEHGDSLANHNLVLADVRDDTKAMCRSVKEATDACLTLLLAGKAELSHALQGTSFSCGVCVVYVPSVFFWWGEGWDRVYG